MNEIETPQEKAKRLGVPLIPKPFPIINKPLPDYKDLQKFKSQIMKVVAICGSCSRELRINEKHPCGRGDCPFGTLGLHY
jgi:hypothetical protein